MIRLLLVVRYLFLELCLNNSGGSFVDKQTIARLEQHIKELQQRDEKKSQEIANYRKVRSIVCSKQVDFVVGIDLTTQRHRTIQSQERIRGFFECQQRT